MSDKAAAGTVQDAPVEGDASPSEVDALLDYQSGCWRPRRAAQCGVVPRPPAGAARGATTPFST